MSPKVVNQRICFRKQLLAEQLLLGDRRSDFFMGGPLKRPT
jgi:hypothetical protein